MIKVLRCTFFIAKILTQNQYCSILSESLIERGFAMRVNMKKWCENNKDMFKHLILENISNAEEITSSSSYNFNEDINIQVLIAGVEVDLPEFTNCVNNIIKLYMEQTLEKCGVNDFNKKVQEEVDKRYKQMLNEKEQKPLEDLEKIEEMVSNLRSMLEMGMNHIEWK